MFAGVKELRSAMIGRLESEAESEAAEKVFCDTELWETNTRKASKTVEIEHASSVAAKGDLEQGAGVKLALKVPIE